MDKIEILSSVVVLLSQFMGISVDLLRYLAKRIDKITIA